MPAPAIQTLRPFVPAKDLAASLRFYRMLGFVVEREFGDGSGAIVEAGAASFILQRFFVAEHAENFMMQLVVPDLAAWWSHIASLDLPAAFGVPAPKPPARQPWGLDVAYVTDPTGVLWHVVATH